MKAVHDSGCIVIYELNFRSIKKATEVTIEKVLKTHTNIRAVAPR